MKIPANWVGLVWSGCLYSFHNWFCGICLTFYNLNSSCIFSALFSIPFTKVLKRRICLTIKSFFSW